MGVRHAAIPPLMMARMKRHLLSRRSNSCTAIAMQADETRTIQKDSNPLSKEEREDDSKHSGGAAAHLSQPVGEESLALLVQGQAQRVEVLQDLLGGVVLADAALVVEQDHVGRAVYKRAQVAE